MTKHLSPLQILQWIDRRLQEPNWRESAMIFPGSVLHEDIKAAIAKLEAEK